MSRSSLFLSSKSGMTYKLMPYICETPLFVGLTTCCSACYNSIFNQPGFTLRPCEVRHNPAVVQSCSQSYVSPVDTPYPGELLHTPFAIRMLLGEGAFTSLKHRCCIQACEPTRMGAVCTRAVEAPFHCLHVVCPSVPVD